MTKRLDIFQILGQLNRKQDILAHLSEDEIKQIQPFVIMRWLTGSNNAKQIYFLNELINPQVFALNRHKELVAKLLTVCTFGVSQQYKWIPPVSNNTSFPNISDMLIKAYQCKTSEAKSIISLLSDEDILSIATELGYQQEEMTKIKKELKTRIPCAKSSI